MNGGYHVLGVLLKHGGIRDAMGLRVDRRLRKPVALLPELKMGMTVM